MKKITNYLQAGIIIAFLGVIYYPAFTWMIGCWTQSESYYSHGPLVIIAVLFFLWGKRKRLTELKVEPSNAGIILIVLALFMHLCGLWIKLYFVSAVFMIVLLAGIVLFMWGGNFLKEILFPISYLIFMIPLPLVLTTNIIIKMKLFAAKTAVLLLNKIGIRAVLDGSIIRMINSYLEVEAPCSGLRSLIALMAFGAAFAYLTKHHRIKKWILFISALPIAIGANVLRIVLLGWVSDIYGMKAAQGRVHDFSGFLLFFLAAAGMLIVNSLLTTQSGTRDVRNNSAKC